MGCPKPNSLGRSKEQKLDTSLTDGAFLGLLGHWQRCQALILKLRVSVLRRKHAVLRNSVSSPIVDLYGLCNDGRPFLPFSAHFFRFFQISSILLQFSYSSIPAQVKTRRQLRSRQRSLFFFGKGLSSPLRSDMLNVGQPSRSRCFGRHTYFAPAAQFRSHHQSLRFQAEPQNVPGCSFAVTEDPLPPC
jgi:hypothetical protein